MVQPDKFPFLSEEEFGFACRSFVETFEEVGRLSQTCDWEILGLRRERGKDYVVVTKNLNFNPISRESILMPALSSSDEEADIEFSDQDTEDAEELNRDRVPTVIPRVEYHILLSPIYRVPVLYFSLHHFPLEGQSTLNAVYDYLVPRQMRTEVLTTGPIGGISMVNHPIFDVPVFHVHPCNTAAAMQELGAAEGMDLQYYLQIWIGLIGGHVGLSLPLSSPLELPNMVGTLSSLFVRSAYHKNDPTLALQAARC